MISINEGGDLADTKFHEKIGKLLYSSQQFTFYLLVIQTIFITCPPSHYYNRKSLEFGGEIYSNL